MTKAKQESFEDAEDVELWNQEDASDLTRPTNMNAYDIVVAARDWTVETIVQQVRQGNIDLDPEFQRRNAWRDQRRSRLIESFILSFPVPQIVLAENPKKRKSFIVIDGKQRLMTIAGLYLEDFREYWTQPRFTGLKILEDLNRVGLDSFFEEQKYAQLRRQLGNADIRTTVITGFKDEGVLYDIFYRINTGSVALSSQELRQVLNRGEFARYLLQVTSVDNEIWKILKIDAPDARLRDVELLLRAVAWALFGEDYAGSMKQFLDDAMGKLNRDWKSQRKRVERIVSQIELAVRAVRKVFGDHAGRKYKDGRFEHALNRALFEVQVYFFMDPKAREASKVHRQALVNGFKELSTNPDFLSSIEATTKSIENTETRFESYRQMLERALKVRLAPLPLAASGD